MQESLSPLAHALEDTTLAQVIQETLNPPPNQAPKAMAEQHEPWNALKAIGLGNMVHHLAHEGDSELPQSHPTHPNAPGTQRGKHSSQWGRRVESETRQEPDLRCTWLPH